MAEYMTSEEFLASLGPDPDEMEWHNTEDWRVTSDGKARVFGYAGHKPQALRNLQMVSATGIKCDYCFDGPQAIAYGKCDPECCGETLWACENCVQWLS